MQIDSIHFKGHRCFKKEWAGFQTVKPITVIIGRNNSGKSHLLDLAEAMCATKAYQSEWFVQFSGTLTDQFLTSTFKPNTEGGDLGGDHWHDHGKHLRNAKISWIVSGGQVTKVTFEDEFTARIGLQENSETDKIVERRKAYLAAALKRVTTGMGGKQFRRLSAERDVRPEPAEVQLTLAENGVGATNIIRRYLTTADPRFPREVIQVDLLNAFNEIFGNDGEFTEILVRQHDESPPPGIKSGTWEVFIEQEKKGPVALSRSGSGIKTVLLVLLNLIAMPKIAGVNPSDIVFAFEELENSLHPALLRRLFQYIEKFVTRENLNLFLTTHSSTAVDYFGLSTNAQLVHVSHDGESAKTITVAAHFDKLGVISELGAKPSDLLQANGIVWVEGPSDCLYINRWLDIYSDGKFKEGRDYQCAFYGGSLLARTQFKSPEEAEKDLVNLFQVNPNLIVICDGDRTAKRKRLKDRVMRIRRELERIPNVHLWITNAREIENYIPGEVLQKAMDVSALPSPSQYEIFFPRKPNPDASYIEVNLNRRAIDKMDLAALCVPHMSKANMKNRFEWEVQMERICDRIESWARK